MFRSYCFSILARQTPRKQHVQLPLYDHKTCTSKYQSLGISVSNDQICAGSIEGMDTCDGDSGNPLMKISTSGWVAEGIVSYGRSCGSDFPAVYTKVSNYDNWIRRNLRAWTCTVSHHQHRCRRHYNHQHYHHHHDYNPNESVAVHPLSSFGGKKKKTVWFIM